MHEHTPGFFPLCNINSCPAKYKSVKYLCHHMHKKHNFIFSTPQVIKNEPDNISETMENHILADRNGDNTIAEFVIDSTSNNCSQASCSLDSNIGAISSLDSLLSYLQKHYAMFVVAIAEKHLIPSVAQIDLANEVQSLLTYFNHTFCDLVKQQLGEDLVNNSDLCQLLNSDLIVDKVLSVVNSIKKVISFCKSNLSFILPVETNLHYVNENQREYDLKKNKAVKLFNGLNCKQYVIFKNKNALRIHLYCDELEVLRPLIQDLLTLQNEGILVIFDNMQVRLFGGVATISADNLSSHALAGFQRVFNSAAISGLGRISSSVYGVDKRCPLLDLPYFNVLQSFPPDIMHDMLEGTVPQLVNLILLKFKTLDIITVEQINSELNIFEFGRNDRKNKPVPFVIRTGASINFVGSASQKFCMFWLLPFMIGNRIPISNVYWLLYLQLQDIAVLAAARYC
ncbi:uncharacterized protein LOC124811271 [Hydra vulgaris]|uniref:uncharacterized protein LOC124811271 n=1 Tax=Hydra vulgaris TaxID=6087 RepID=UPI001F5E90B5|nr:uncharacterized protein LOC124811271 [Hydra vulgaris]